jgi:hypothetical protein
LSTVIPGMDLPYGDIVIDIQSEVTVVDEMALAAVLQAFLNQQPQVITAEFSAKINALGLSISAPESVSLMLVSFFIL